MFTKFQLRLPWISALVMLVVSAAGPATTVASPTPLRAGPGWARTADTSLTPASIGGSSARAQAPETFLHTFESDPDGVFPQGGLLEDEDGSLYGTTFGGGLNLGSGGTVFKLTRTQSGRYTESLLYRFGASGAQDGANPEPSNPLARDRTGALYGATRYGGVGTGNGFLGQGIVYKLTPTATGYHETILYSFRDPSAPDGGQPLANPILDRSGALYGTTASGGTCSECLGVVYKLTPAKSGYTFSILHEFKGSGNDGYYPEGGLTMDPSTGDLYGTTSGYGNFLQKNPATGAVFKLHPTASGYVYSIIHIFQGPDGGTPSANVIMDESGALYGTAENGGASFASSNCNGYTVGGCGAVFKLTPTKKGYVESLLYNFTGGLDGANPQASLVADSRGNLYSTAFSDGQYGNGTVFELVRTPKGYREVTLYAFSANDDGPPSSGVVLDGDYLAGETFGGSSGPYQYGSIYALKFASQSDIK